MSGISLTASMRSNLLSLQNIASQQDIVQNRLATGLKVSSAIDNPSSYYTASSLNNRAADSTALLDTMSQGIQTIKAASEAIDSGTKFLEQAKAVANQALETAIPAKEWFAEQVGENGAVVETAQELRQAIADNKATICVYGTIDLGDISTEGGLSLKANQKLVGIGYFGKFSEQYSQIKARASTQKHMINIAQNNCLISDLKLTFDNSFGGNGDANIFRIDGGVRTNRYQSTLRILDITGSFSNTNPNGYIRGGICVFGNSQTNIEGEINIYSSGRYSLGIAAHEGTLNFSETSNVTIKTSGIDGNGIAVYSGSVAHIRGNFFITSDKANAIYNSFNSNNTINIYEGTQLYLVAGSAPIYNGHDAQGKGTNNLNISSGVKIALETGYTTKWYKTTADYNRENISGTAESITFNNIEAMLSVEEAPSWKIPVITPVENTTTVATYLQILSQFDMVIADSSYKGINLLDGQNLKINFNEDRSSKIDVTGVKADSESLGLKTKEWKTAEDIEKSVSELEEAINSLRSFASAFGNYYSIVTTRQDFTENLINVLEEGADKLTLADMNQESANMLALQTSQQLAVNSLSLASQASQTVLKLF